MKTRVFISIIFCFVFLLCAKKVLAATTVSASSLYDQVFATDELTLTVTIETTSNDDAYLRAVFYKPGTTSYFGCTKSSAQDYVCSGAFINYPKATGSNQFSITVKPDTAASGYKGTGDYNFQVFRCTESTCNPDHRSTVQLVHITDYSSTPTPVPTPTATPTPTPSATPTPTSTPQQPTGITLSEFLACPTSGGSEWVEIYNSNDFSVTLSNWKLKDSISNFSEVNTVLSAKEYKVIEIPSAKAFYNNDSDIVKLVNGADVIVDTYSYSSCNSTQSWAKNAGNWVQTNTPTKGSANQFVASATPTATPKVSPSPSPSGSPSPLPTDNSNMILGAQTQMEVLNAGDTEASPAARVKKDQGVPVFALLAILFGLATLCGLGGFVWYDWKKKSVQ